MEIGVKKRRDVKEGQGRGKKKDVTQTMEKELEFD